VELKRQLLLDGMKTFNGGTNITKVRYRGKWIPLQLSMDSGTSHDATLAFDELTEEEARELAQPIAPLAAVRLEDVDGEQHDVELPLSHKHDGNDKEAGEEDVEVQELSTRVAMAPVLVGG
jgi:hypothetical protein